MMFGRSFGYAMRALSHLATRDKTSPLASHEIAKAQKMPERFLLVLTTGGFNGVLDPRRVADL